MASPDCELNRISAELNQLSLRRKELLERKKMHSICQELRNRVEFGKKEEASCQLQFDNIDDKLKQLTEKETELQKTYEKFLTDNNEKNSKKEVTFSCQKPDVPACDVFYVAVPNIPAPTVIMDVDNFPLSPCRTQCPECHQFIMTETYTSVSSVTWLVCLMTALMGGVAGCCLIPFCLDQFKSTTHRCPKCRTLITTIKKF